MKHTFCDSCHNNDIKWHSVLHFYTVIIEKKLSRDISLVFVLHNNTYGSTIITF